MEDGVRSKMWQAEMNTSRGTCSFVMSLWKIKANLFDSYESTIEEASAVVLDRYFTFVPLKLDEGGKIGYVFKALGAAVRCLRVVMEWYEADEEGKLLQGEVFQKLITDLTMEAGDADTNACIAGALLGAFLGQTDLPSHWRDNLKHGIWLKRMTEGMCQIVGVGEESFQASEYLDAAQDGGNGFLSVEELTERWARHKSWRAGR